VKKKSKKGPCESWGKHGILREVDLWTKDQEFHLWLQEVRRADAEQLSNWDKKALFKDFMEDFNTCTMPSKKFYDLEKWETKEAAKRKKQMFKELKDSKRKKDNESVPLTFNDEEDLRIMRKREREQKEAQVYRDKILEATLNAANREKDSMLKILGVVSDKERPT